MLEIPTYFDIISYLNKQNEAIFVSVAAHKMCKTMKNDWKYGNLNNVREFFDLS